jgi:hypothetical protein
MASGGIIGIIQSCIQLDGLLRSNVWGYLNV